MIIKYFFVVLLLSFVFVTSTVWSDLMPEYDNEHLNGDDFTLTWSFLYQKNGEKCYLHVINLENNGDIALKDQKWALYFNLIHRIIPESITPFLQINLINGHFYKITPTNKFKNFRDTNSDIQGIGYTIWILYGFQ